MSTEPTPDKMRRIEAEWCGGDWPVDEFLEAADLIEAQQARIEELEAVIDAIGDDLGVDLDTYLDALVPEEDR